MSQAAKKPRGPRHAYIGQPVDSRRAIEKRAARLLAMIEREAKAAK